jgi:hypothetical protein
MIRLEDRAIDQQVAAAVDWKDPNETPPFSTGLTWALAALERRFPESEDVANVLRIVWKGQVATVELERFRMTAREVEGAPLTGLIESRKTSDLTIPLAICRLILDS